MCVEVYSDRVPDEEAAEPVDAAPEIPAVTIDDLASFAPAPPALQAEPGAAGIKGMPTNFVAPASEQITTGSLFGQPVTVRFTPTGYVFDHGDGTTSRATTGGATWASLGQAQFTATSTSHAYSDRGTYVTTATVEYAAAVDFGTGYLPVAGTLTATTAGYPVQIYELHTALVERTCAENPSGPGC